MKAVFLDTVGLIAVWDEDDQWHAPAARVFTQLVRQQIVMVTTPYVLAECGNAASRRPYRADVVELRATLERRKQVIFPTDEDWQEAWRRYAADRPGGPGVVDQLSFLVMRRYGLTQAFTNDQHFRTAGFEPLF